MTTNGPWSSSAPGPTGLPPPRADATPLAVVAAGLDPVAEMFTERHDFARIRAGMIAANPQLQERELIKLQNLAGAIKAALVERGVSANAAILAAQAGVTIFHVVFAHWVKHDDATGFRRLMDESLDELRPVTAAEGLARKRRRAPDARSHPRFAHQTSSVANPAMGAPLPLRSPENREEQSTRRPVGRS